MRRVLLPALLVGAVLAAPAHGAVVNVNCDRHDLQAKIDAADPGDVLRIKGRCVGSFGVDKRLTLDGHPRATLDAAGLGRTLTILAPVNVTLLDLTITGGHVSGQSVGGGGIDHGGGALVLRRVSVVGNVAEATHGVGAVASGGGIHSLGGSLSIFDSLVSGNVARAATQGSADANGGGIHRQGGLRIVRGRVLSNRAEALTAEASAFATGGGLWLDGGDVTLQSSRIEGNVAAVHAPNGPATNVAADGGGIGTSQIDSLELTGSVVSGNRASAVGPGGTVTAEGGGFSGYAGSAEIAGSRLVGNEARAFSAGGALTRARGGALYIGTNRLNLRRSRISDSVAAATTGGSATATGGGIDFWEDDLYVDSSRFTGNSVEAEGGTGFAFAAGGAILTTGHSIFEIRRSTYDRNRSRASGPSGSAAVGGALDVDGSLLLLGSTVSRNAADAPQGQALGGGLRLPEGGASATITNSTVASNRAAGTTARGGGIDTNANLALRAATFARNSARIGGGLYVEEGTTTLHSTILGLNRGTLESPDCGGPVTSAGWNLIAKLAGCMVTPAVTDRTNRAPKLGQLRSNSGPTQTILPLAGSPARNWVPKAQCTAKDQRGVKRPQGQKCEIGAVEIRAGRQP